MLGGGEGGRGGCGSNCNAPSQTVGVGRAEILNSVLGFISIWGNHCHTIRTQSARSVNRLPVAVSLAILDANNLCRFLNLTVVIHSVKHRPMTVVIHRGL